MVQINVENYLRPSLVSTGTVVKILDEGQIRSAEDTPFGRETFEIHVEMNGVKYLWTMNKTTQRKLAEAWGTDTKNWIGKKVILSIKEQNVRGILRNVIYGVPKED